MPVEIVNPEPDPEVKKEITCRSCGVRLSYLPIDVKKYEGRDYSGGPDGQTWIDCPKCGNEVVIDSW